MQGGIFTHPLLVDDRAEGIDEARRKRRLHRAVPQAQEGPEHLGTAEGAKLDAIGAEGHKQNARDARRAQGLLKIEEPPEGHIEHGGLGQRIGQGEIPAPVGAAAEQVIEDKA